MNVLNRLFAAIIALLVVSPVSLADDDVFARQGEVVITQDEIDASFARVPEHLRMAVIRDGGKVDEIIQSLLRYKQMARDARENGFADDPVMQARLALVAEKELAEAWLEHVIANAPEADYEALAYELYIVEKDQFLTEETVDVSHILIGTNSERSDEEALELATRLRGELVADPSKFEQYVELHSDDPGSARNEGRYAGVKRGQMVQAFEEAAFTMEQAGEISEPVKTNYGYHIIRLDSKSPPEVMSFDEVKPRLMEVAREERLKEFRLNYVLGVTHGPIEIPDGAIEKMLKRHFGENLELAPDLYNR